jgi:aryl carrier-like protein
MLQLSLAQLSIEGQPLLAQFRRQGFELSLDRLAQPGNIHLAEHVRLLLKRNELTAIAGGPLHVIAYIDE